MKWWLQLSGINLQNSIGSEYKNNGLETPKPTMVIPLEHSIGISSTVTCQYESGIKRLKELSFFDDSKNALEKERELKSTPISLKSYVFGPGVLVSKVNDRVIINFVPVVEDGSSVIGDVIRIVLNNSILLDVVAMENDHETFYFIWEEKRRENEHEKHLARLSGIFNVTKINLDVGPGVHVATPTANLIILYGVRRDRATAYVLAELEKRAAVVAWQREKALIGEITLF